MKVLTVTFSAFMLVMMGFASTSNAQTVFMVQLGTFDSEAKAQQNWAELSGAFPDLFDELRYTPNEVVSRPDNFVSYRTQAGPIPTRIEAQNLCAALTEANYECYVVETAMFFSDDKEVTTITPAKAAPKASAPVAVAAPAAPQSVPVLDITVKEQAAPKPVAVAPQATPVENGATPDTAYSITPKNAVAAPIASVPQAVASSETVSVPDSPVVAAQPIQGSARGNIAVAEAIPVPLSQAAPARNPYLERGNRLMDAHPSSSQRVNSYWADISYFKNEADAMRYVQVLKSRDSLLPNKLRIRITRPYGNVRGTQRLSLRMGPFLTTRPIRRLCGITRAEKLRCRAIKDLGGSVRHQSVTANRKAGSRGSSNSYAKLRKAVNSESRRLAAASGSAYYVQLGSFLSPRAADDKWAELKKLHGRALRGAKKDVITPDRGSSRSRLFRLRTGPYGNYAKADGLCSALKRQGSLCLVVKK